MRPHASKRVRGFSLIETSLAVVIVGTGVLSIMAAQQAYHQKNNWAQRNSTGVLLANEIREFMSTLPAHDPTTNQTYAGPEPGEPAASGLDYDSMLRYDDVDDFAGAVDEDTGLGTGMSFSPPINARREQIADMAGWTQSVSVVNVLSTNVGVSDALVQPLGATDMMRVTVTVTYQGPYDDEPYVITDMTWLVAD